MSNPKQEVRQNINEMLDEYTFVGQIYISLKCTEIAYRNYHQNGKKFLYARILKTYNNRIRDLLLEKSHLLSENLQNDALKLITHYDIWIEKWNELKNNNNHSLEDEFIFQNKDIFPSDASKNLENEYFRLEKIKQDKV